MKPTLRERFFAKIDTDGPGGCWLWTAARNNHGYGVIRVGGRGGRLWLAHRLSWLLHHWPIPQGLCILHQCDVPACTNPAHLFIGTMQDNIQDKVTKGRARGGVRFGEANNLAKLTEDQVRQIRNRRGETQCALGIEFGVSQSNISDILRGNIWREVV